MNNEIEIKNITINNHVRLKTQIDFRIDEMSNKVKTFYDVNRIQNVVDEDAQPLNLNIYKITFEDESKFSLDIETYNLQLVQDVQKLSYLDGETIKNKYSEIFLNPDDKLVIDLGKYKYDIDQRKIASNNYKVLLSTNGNVPVGVMLHIQSVATLMLADIIDVSIGSDYLKDICSKYGILEITFQQKGYLFMKINEKPSFWNTRNLVIRTDPGLK